MGVVYFLCCKTILMVVMYGIAVLLCKWWTLNSVATMREVHSTVSLSQGSGIFFMFTVEKTCSCFGHSDVEITDELTARTRIEIDRAVADDVRIFLFGGRSDFDDLCYDLVTEKKNANPQLNIKRVFCFALDKQLRKPPSWFVRKEYEALECPTICALHKDKPHHLHIHLWFAEKEPKCKYRKKQTEYRHKGKIDKRVLDRMHVRLNMDISESHPRLYISRDEALKELKKISALKDIITKDDVKEAVLELSKTIPKGSSFHYGSKDNVTKVAVITAGFEALKAQYEK